MKKKFILLPLVCAFLYLTLSSYYYGPAHYAGFDRTGATGTVGCTGFGCHAMVAKATTTVSVILLSGGTPVTTYTPGATYTLEISGQNTSTTHALPAFGFQVSVVKVVSGTTSDAGTMVKSSEPAGTDVCSSCISGYSVSIWEHYNSGLPAAIPATTLVGGGVAGTTYVESITWTAPSAGTGCVTIYGVLNAVDGDNSADTTDWWNNTSLVINEAVAGITGTASMCVGATTTLTDATPCGVWSSSNTSVATVSTGVVTGVSGGTATISYTAGVGNTATKVVTVIAAPPNILGTTSVCVGSTTTLSDAAVIGTWTSSNTTVATVSLITGTVTGVSASTATITFTAASSGCSTSITVTVNPLPSSISGATSLCPSTTSTLTDAGGGTWVSNNSSVAAIVLGTGVITTGIPGTATISYTLPVTGCAISATVTVNPAPSAITGTMVVCPGFTTALSDPGGGTWNSGNTSVATVVTGTGVVTGITGGTSTITYTLGTGCTATAIVTVNPLPPSINGTTKVCAGLTTALSDATGGGTWTSGNTPIATIGASSGVVTGGVGAGGTAIITYTVPVTGCIITATVTVNPLPSGITGILNVCPGTSTTLSDPSGGGTWASSNTAVATVATGTSIVSGVIAGTSTITYTLPTGCTAIATVTVNPSPPAIGGIASVCSGLTTGLSDAGGGTWTSGNTSVATIGSTTGIVSTVALFGNSVITYTLPVTGCTANITVTVVPSPGAIAGTPAVCSGSTTLFSDGGVGTWSSSNTSVATVSGTGTVTGIGAGGTATITYTLTNGCTATKTATVNPLPVAIMGTTRVCTGSTTTLSDATGGGIWASGTTTVATIGSSSGIVSGLGAGGTTSIITYTLATGCKINATVTVNPLPGTINGTLSACIGATTTLSDATGSGTWTSSNSAVATVVSGTGVVTGVSGGTATISYTLTATGCSTSKNVTINLLPSSISGATVICAGSTTALSDAGGGTWGSSSTTVAIVGLSTGIVTGVKGGSATITYTLPVTGCETTQTLTVNPLSPITGITSLCSGLTTTLSDATIGGTWTSSNSAVATIGSGTGFVTSGTAGATTINYTLPTGCVATATVTIVSAPSAITGNGTVCLGLTSALSDAGGGTWTSSNTAHASVGAGTGVVTGVALGTATISYSLGTSCTVTAGVTVDPVPSGITGTASVCAGGATTTLSDITAGGVWSSGNTAVATVGSSGTVTGISAGTATISYTFPTGCPAVKVVTVNSLPAAISGADSVCFGSTTVLSDAGGGTWVSGNTGVATVGLGTGIVSTVSTGTATITYTLPVTGCQTATTVTVNSLPVSISGASGVCVASAITLSDGSGGGTWTSGNTNVIVDLTLGTVTGAITGTSSITYTLPTGCSAFKTVTVNPLPASITGPASVCAGLNTILSDAKSGGTWSSSNTGVATIFSGTGVVTGVSAGTSTIIYTLTATGCSASAIFTVDPLPSAITGTATMCAGFTTVLSDTTSGGVWSSSNTTVATVGSATGVVAGIKGGSATITYMLGTGCITTTAVTVNALPIGITGAPGVCIGSTTALSDITTGGTWSSSNTSVATIVPGTGVVTGVTSGTAIITYALVTGCEAHFLITVNPLPSVITGTDIMCAGAVNTLSDTTSGGAWSSSNTGVATIGSGTGNVAGISAGTATITYSLPTGCMSTIAVTINPLPVAISGTAHVCQGLTTTLSDGTSGGAWSSGATTVAVIGSTGVVTGVTASTATITYSLTTGCLTTINVTVNPLPSTISGTTHVCQAATTALSDLVTGGNWTSSNTAIAKVSGTGVVTGGLAGSATITYTLPTGCNTVISVTVNPSPAAGAITGQSIVCLGTANTLSDAAPGGSWSSGNTSVATVATGTGIVTGVSAGFVTISYSVTNGCGTAHATATDTVIDIPSAGTITGSDSVCVGDSIVLADTVTGGVWTSSNANATVSSTGTITGVAAGASVISYSKSTVCGTATATLSVTINSMAFCKTGVKILPGAAEFKVYPNPSTGVFIVEIPATSNGSTVTILDVVGKVIERRAIDDTRMQKVSFDLGSTPPGSYIVKVDAGDITYRQKIVIW